MSSLTTITTGLSITIDGADAFTDYLEGCGKRMARQELLPILKGFMGPVASAMRSNVDSESGALAKSLVERSGSGDRPGVISVFVAPTATRKQLIKKWGGGRKQQRGWAADIEPGRGRRSVFYAPFVELGHRMVRRGADGSLHVVGSVDPHPFAAPAAPLLDSQGDTAAEAILRRITGED